jgi:hypothetical protein
LKGTLKIAFSQFPSFLLFPSRLQLGTHSPQKKMLLTVLKFCITVKHESIIDGAEEGVRDKREFSGELHSLPLASLLLRGTSGKLGGPLSGPERSGRPFVKYRVEAFPVRGTMGKRMK